MRQTQQLSEKVHQSFENYELHIGLSEIFAYLADANRLFTRTAPWADAKALAGEIAAHERTVTTQRLAATLAEQIYGLAIGARCLLPFIPRAAAELHGNLGIPITTHYRQPFDVSGRKTGANSVLFPRRGTA